LLEIGSTDRAVIEPVLRKAVYILRGGRRRFTNIGIHQRLTVLTAESDWPE
jgi:hypothetical protein